MFSPSSTKGSTAGTNIYKCNHCDYITENKFEIGQHLTTLHPQCADNDYNIILTNRNCRWDADDGISMNLLSNATPALTEKEDDIKSERMDADNSEEDFNMSTNEMDTAEHLNADGSNDFTVLCPLCQDPFNDKKSLEKHLMTIHSVNSDGLARLLNLVDASHWLNSNNGNNSISGNSSMISSSNKIGKSPGSSASSCADSSDIECVTCGTSFKSMSELFTRKYSCTFSSILSRKKINK